MARSGGFLAEDPGRSMSDRRASFGLIAAIACVLGLGCGASDPPRTAPEVVTFAEVNAIVKLRCTGATCHGVSHNNSTIFEDNQASFDARSALIKTRIEAPPGTLRMPPAGAPPLTDEEKRILAAYCDRVSGSALIDARTSE